MKKRKKKVFNKNITYQITDAIIVFVGFGIVILGIFSFSNKFPLEFAISATIASFLFVYADFVVESSKTFTLFRLIAYIILVFLAVIGLIVLPVILMMNPSFYDTAEQLSNPLTLMALGLVLCLMGFKNSDHKDEIRNKELNEIKLLNETNKIKIEELELSIKELEDRLTK